MSPDEFAQLLELKEYEATQRRATLPTGPSLSHCEDCGDEIPLERQKAMFVRRCILCQEDFENLKKMRGNHG